MATPRFDRDRAIKILVDAATFGDKKACDRWDITVRTLQNYRKRLDGDTELSRSFAIVHKTADYSWKIARQRFLQSAINKLKAMIEAATADQLDEVSRAIERVGKLDVASEALGVDVGSGTNPRGDGAPSHAGFTGEDQAEAAPFTYQ